MGHADYYNQSIVIVIFNQGVHSFLVEPWTNIQYRHIQQTDIQKQTCLQNTQLKKHRQSYN